LTCREKIHEHRIISKYYDTAGSITTDKLKSVSRIEWLEHRNRMENAAAWLVEDYSDLRQVLHHA
jgi:hypothetical protein